MGNLMKYVFYIFYMNIFVLQTSADQPFYENNKNKSPT